MAEVLMRFEADVRREHFAELSKVAGKRFARGGSMLAISMIYWVVLLLVSLALFRFADRNLVAVDAQAFAPSDVTLIAFLSGVVATFALQAMMARSIAAAHRDRALREGGSYLGPRVFWLDDEGVHIEGSHGRTMTRWSAIMELTDTASTFLLWTDPGAAIMVPKAAFADDAARTTFRRLAEERITAAAPLV